jgi:transposase InsO family protein
MSERITDKDLATKVARRRLSVLEMAEALGNVSEACRRSGMDRTSFYEWRRRFQTHGLEGLKDLPPITKSQPNATTPETEAKIIEASLEHPSWGCVKLSDSLKLRGVSVSSPTVQKILIRNGMASVYDRWMKVEQRHLDEGIELTAEQIAKIEKYNPCFKERHVESSRPGELLCADTFFVGSLKGIGKVYLHGVVDTYGSYGFGFLHTGKKPECAATLLHNDVLPFYADHGLKVGAILTDNGPEFCGTQNHPFELYLALNGIEHRRTRVRTPRTNGFIERFNRTILDEFFRVAFRENYYETVDALQADMDVWLEHYNRERPHRGYRNRGKRPYDTVLEFAARQDSDSRNPNEKPAGKG